MLASIGTRRPSSADELISPALAAALDQLDLASRRTFFGRLQGERRSKARGRSVEFEDYRQYVPGDDLRHIDWNVFARLDRLFIKIFQEEQDLALHLVLDASPSMDAGNPNKLVFSQRLAMALAYLGLVSNNRVLVTVFGVQRTPSAGEGSAPSLRQLPALRGRGNVPRLAGFLLDNTFAPPEYASAPSGRSPNIEFAAAMRTLAAERSGRGVLILISDLLIPGGYEGGLKPLGAGTGGWDTTLLQVLAPGETDPAVEIDPAGRRAVIGDLRLTDAETGRAAEVTVTTDLLKRYRERFDRHQRSLNAFAVSRGMAHMIVPSDADLNSLLLNRMRRWGVLK